MNLESESAWSFTKIWFFFKYYEFFEVITYFYLLDYLTHDTLKIKFHICHDVLESEHYRFKTWFFFLDDSHRIVCRLLSFLKKYCIFLFNVVHFYRHIFFSDLFHLLKIQQIFHRFRRRITLNCIHDPFAMLDHRYLFFHNYFSRYTECHPWI